MPTTTIEGKLTWFSPVIPEESYEILIGDTDVIQDFLPLDERQENLIRNNRIGPWYCLKGKRVRLTLEVFDADDDE